jgi:hypothetical protein
VEAFVHQLIKEEGAAHHAARLGQKEFLILEMQALDEGGDKRGEVVGSRLEQGVRGGIALIRSSQNHRENLGEDFIGDAVGEGLDFVPGSGVEFLKNQAAHRGVGASTIEFVQSGNGSAAADIESAAFVSEERTVAANAGDLALRIAPNRGGTGAGNQDNRGTFAGGLQSKLKIGAHHHGFAGKFFLEEAFHFSFGIRLARAGKTRAKSDDFRRRDIGGLQGPARGFTNGSQRAAKSDAHRIGGAAAAARKDVARFVHEDAFRFRAAAIEPENIAHNQSIREAGPMCARAKGGVLKGLRVRRDWPGFLTGSGKRKTAGLPPENGGHSATNPRERHPAWWRPPHLLGKNTIVDLLRA